jgi:hypothetical protein
MRPCGTKLSLQFGQPVHPRKAYSNAPLIDTFIYLQRLSLRFCLLMALCLRYR